jgi:hypothetical protein
MDTFAAVALASEPAHPNVLQNPPVMENDNIITDVMWR